LYRAAVRYTPAPGIINLGKRFREWASRSEIKILRGWVILSDQKLRPGGGGHKKKTKLSSSKNVTLCVEYLHGEPVPEKSWPIATGIHTLACGGPCPQTRVVLSWR
jgi:hypothetical protein